MSRVVEYDPITGRIKRYDPSADTGEWEGKPNVLINPVLPPDIESKRRDYIVDNGTVRAMTVGEKNTRDAQEQARKRQEQKDEAFIIIDGDNELGDLFRALVIQIVKEFNRIRTSNGDPTITKAQVIQALKQTINKGDSAPD